MATSPRYALAHEVKGQVLRAQNRWEEAIPEYETALASNPNLLSASNGLGWCKLFAGSIEEVIPLAEQAIRRSPRDPHIGTRYSTIGNVHLPQSHPDEAILWPPGGNEIRTFGPPHDELVPLAKSDPLNGETESLVTALSLL